MEQAHYLISDAAKKVEVESHVLRYWEEELDLPIKRNELGHRYYTKEDVERFREVKRLKEQGLQLKAIRSVLKNGGLARFEASVSKEADAGNGENEEQEQENHMIEIIDKRDLTEQEPVSREEKGIRLQILLQHMIGEAVRENSREAYEDMKESILKEMDYQFRQQEEKGEEWEAERKKREDEHFRKIDEMLRTCSRRGRIKDKDKDKNKDKGSNDKGSNDKVSRLTARKKPSII